MTGTLEGNLEALAGVDPELAERLSACPPARGFSLLEAKNGSPVPAIQGQSRPLAFHSTVDPQREGRRIREQYPGAGFVVFLGLGGGYQISPFLADVEISGILIVETDASLVKSILQAVDLSRILADERVRLLVDPLEGGVENALLATYLPSVMGNLASVPLGSRLEMEGAFFASVSRGIQSAASRIGADYAAQSRFAKRWLANTLANLPTAESAALSLEGRPTVMIAGAGPSLDAQLPLIRARREGALLIAADTALPSLLGGGIIPDLAICIDCQHYGYHHALSARDGSRAVEDVAFLIDLSSPHLLARSAAKHGYFAGGHPFSRYIRRHWRPFTALDTSGGSVAHAAVSLALSLGARQIILYGLDFSYPDGKPYARGTYLSSLFDSRSSRLMPAESSFIGMVFRSNDVMTDRIPGGLRYTTPLLLSYRQEMETLLSNSSVRVTAAPGRGLELSLGKGPEAAAGAKRGHGTVEIWNTPQRPKESWRAFLEGYRSRLAALPPPSRPAGAYCRSLTPDQREILATILPLVPCIERETRESSDRASLLEQARELTLERIKQALDE